MERSKNYQEYLARREQVLNQNAQAGLVGARHRGGNPGGAYQARYQAQAPGKYGRVGQDPTQPGYCPPGSNWVGSDTGAAHGREPTGPVPTVACTPLPPRCDCHVVGANTLNTDGVPSGGFDTVTLDSGDADYFLPYYIAVTARQVNTTDEGLIVGATLPVLLTDSRSGQDPNMRRASTSDPQFGVWADIYGNEKELECVDWRKFGSQNNQQLVMTFYNPNTVSVHVFVNLWGLAAA